MKKIVMKLMKKQQRNLNNMDEEIRFRQCKICGKEFNSNGFQIGYDVDDPYVLTRSVIRCYPILSDYNKLYESIEELYYEYEEEKSGSLDLYYDDLYFCSLECLKEFFNYELDKLGKFNETGEY